MPKLTVYTPRKKDRFRRLRGELLANGLQNADVGHVLNRSAEHISRCLNGKAQWGLAEQYAIMDAIHRPYRDLHIIFPPNGNDDVFDNARCESG